MKPSLLVANKVRREDSDNNWKACTNDRKEMMKQGIFVITSVNYKLSKLRFKKGKKEVLFTG